MKALFTFSLLFISGFIFAQKPPLIGSEKGVKEKFILIKKGLPDIKKNLTENDENFVEEVSCHHLLGNPCMIVLNFYKFSFLKLVNGFIEVMVF